MSAVTVFQHLLDSVVAHLRAQPFIAGARNGAIPVLPENISDFTQRLENAVQQQNGLCVIPHFILPDEVDTDSPLLIAADTPVQITFYENVAQNSGEGGAGLGIIDLAVLTWVCLHRWAPPAHPNLAQGACLQSRSKQPIRALPADANFNRLLLEMYVNGAFLRSAQA